MTAKHSEITKLSFEDSLKELEEIVRTLETGTQELDSSIEKYERATALKNHCENKLKEAKLKVQEIVQSTDGKLEMKKFNAK